MDLTEEYNTTLTDDEEKQFRAWARKNKVERDLYDYDMRGAWKAGAGRGEGGHFTDEFKKPNHPTFSTGSRYSTDEAPGGVWAEDAQGRWSFTPSAANLGNMSANQLRQYFYEREPNAVLNLPRNYAE